MPLCVRVSAHRDHPDRSIVIGGIGVRTGYMGDRLDRRHGLHPMPWRIVMAEGERKLMVEAYLAGEASIAELARRFGASRKTAYKWLARFEAEGAAGLEDRSRRPHSNSLSPSDHVVEQILDIRRQHPMWGARKIRRLLHERSPDIVLPAASTIIHLLKRHGLVPARRRRKRTPAFIDPFSSCGAPNMVWGADFKIAASTIVKPSITTKAASLIAQPVPADASMITSPSASNSIGASAVPATSSSRTGP